MACVENIPPPNADSEMEEGEIVDDLSDISSEEEFLLRQRLQVLETYNNVLERKKAKRSTMGPGTKRKKVDTLGDLSEISATDLDDYYPQVPQKTIKVQKRLKVHHRQRRKKDEPIISYRKTKDHKNKTNYPKRKLEVKVVSETSDESEDEYRNRRRKLADAVVVNKNKNDKTSLSERLQKMLCGINPEPKALTEIKIVHTEDSPMSPPQIDRQPVDKHAILKSKSEPPQTKSKDKTNSFEFIDLCTDEDSKTNTTEVGQDTVDSVNSGNVIDGGNKKISEINISDQNSDEDLELLRQHALKTKSAKEKVALTNPSPQDNKVMSEDEDSDTAELRLICLKSALLKKAIEMKQKQKLKKKLSQSTNFPDDLITDNNTDIESVDMDIGSDADDRAKENPENCAKIIETDANTANENGTEKDVKTANIPEQDELEDDEDLLRAKLLTSLSKNLPNLVNPSIVSAIELESTKEPEAISSIPLPPITKPVVSANPVPEEKRFIINLGESDSEGEHEATKNLTKMHLKLSEQIDFQQKLDMFLKSTRMEVEKKKLPDVVQESDTPKKNEKFVAKAVKHLPKSEQIEYKILVKRMAELEKIKQARQSSMNLNLQTKMTTPLKDTLKQRNATIDSTKLSALNSLEEKIKTSRKNIAEESAKMLKLKEEGNKLSQKYKIVATELRNIKTAIALNRKQTRSVQNTLTKIRLHHQMLLKSSITSTHSKINGVMPPISHIIPKLQKENNPSKKDESKNPTVQKTARVVRDPMLITPRLSVQIDVTSNIKVVKMPDKTDANDKSKINLKAGNKNDDLPENRGLSTHPVVEKGGGKKELEVLGNRMRDVDDYRSPLDAFGSTTWEGDPNAILCPFEVGGECKDADCKYLHTKSRTK